MLQGECMRLSWRDLGTPRADRAAGKAVELSGFPVTVMPAGSADHFLMMAEPGCRCGSAALMIQNGA